MKSPLLSVRDYRHDLDLLTSDFSVSPVPVL